MPSEDLEPVRWEVRGTGDNAPEHFSDRALATVRAATLQRQHPADQFLVTGFSRDDAPVETQHLAPLA